MDFDTAQAIRDLATSGRLSEASVEAVALVLDTEPSAEAADETADETTERDTSYSSF